MTTSTDHGSRWEEYHQTGYFETHHPFDDVLGFVYRYSKMMGLKGANVLEVGCGTGNNLGFLDGLGLQGYGIDISETAIAKASRKVPKAHFSVGSFSALPYKDDFFSLVFDRKSLTCAPKSEIKPALQEIHRVLAPGGYFLFTPLSDADSRFQAGEPVDGFVAPGDKKLPSGMNFRGYSFFSLQEIREIFKTGWELVEYRLIELREMHEVQRTNLASWEVIVRKK